MQDANQDSPNDSSDSQKIESEPKKRRTRKLKYGEKTQSISARLPEPHVKMLQVLGEGCLTRGIILASKLVENSDAHDIKRAIEAYENSSVNSESTRH